MVRFCALLALLVFLTTPAAASAAPSSSNAWRDASGIPAPSRAGARPLVAFDRVRALRLDHAQMRAVLADARPEVSLPAPDGTFRRFALRPSQVMEPRLAAAHPEIQTFRGRGIDDPRATIHLTQTPSGLDASVRGPRGAWYVNPYYQRDDSLYASYYGRDLPEDTTQFVEREPIPSGAEASLLPERVAGPSVSLRTYRLALLSDNTYATYFGSANVLAAKVTLVNRVNQVYEDDFAIRMVLIAGTDALNLDTAAKMTGANGPCGANACFTTAQAADCGGALDRTMYVIGQLAGARNYDIGHIALGANGGGIAYLGVVGTDWKAGGCTGVTTPKGDLYAIDYVAHEMGHQFGGNHTFNSQDCSGNRNAGTSVEPGSGSSIMAYAGICGADDLQPHSDPYFSQRSLDEITTYVNSVQPSVNEMQAVSLTGFGAGDSYTLTYNGSTTAPITTTTSSNAIKTAIQGITGRTVTISNSSAGGYTITFGDTATASMLSLTNPIGVTGYVGETQSGGPATNGGTATSTPNTAPLVSAPAAVTIPMRTPFALTGSATDGESDPLTYLWEQNDTNSTATALLSNTNKGSGPLFRQFGTYANVSAAGTLTSPSPGENAATASPTRVFPDMAQVLAGNTNAAAGTCSTTPAATALDCFSEFLPNSARTMHFRLTARDGNAAGGGTGKADTTVTVATSGPFRVTSQSAATSVSSATPLAVAWDVAGTTAAPVSAANVRISLSTDGGATFPHELAASTPNDGSQSVTLPAVTTTQARIKVEAVGNVFFAVNAANFTVTASSAPSVTNDASGATVQYSDALPAITVSATDSDTAGSSLTAGASGLPAGIALTANAASGNSRTWTVGGIATAAPGSYPVTVTVSDGAGHSGQTSFTITVTAETAGSVSYIGDTMGVVGTDVHLEGTFGDMFDGFPGNRDTATMTFKEGATVLCADLDVSGGSASCDVPLAAGDHTITVVLGGTYSGSDSTGSVHVNAAPTAAPVVSNPAAGNTLSVQYSDALSPALTITATDADTSASSLTASASGLPAGMSLTRPSVSAASWTVSGAVQGALGTYPAFVTVSDGVNRTTTQFTIEVTAEDATVTYTGDTQVTSPATTHLAATVAQAADGSAGNLGTATVTFKDGATTLCSGSCDVSLPVGTHSISVIVGGRYTGSGSATVNVVAAPVASSDGSRSVQYSDALDPTVTVTATDADTAASALMASASGLPAGMVLARTSASVAEWTVSGATTAPLGTYPVTVTVSDGTRTGQTSFTIDVVAENATVTYSGDTSGTAGTPVHLAATVAEVPDGSPGSLSNATVTFKEATITLCTAACDVSLPAGTHSISVSAGGRYTGAATGSVTVAAASPVAAGGGARSVQYSDALSPGLTIMATDADTAASALTASAAGLPAGLSLSRPSASQASWVVAGAVTAAPGAYPVTVTVSDGVRTDQEQFTITVTAEDATVTYSGDALVTYPSQVRLAADVAGASDGTPGDLTTAHVTFKEGTTTLCDSVAVSGATATCDVALGLGDHTISMTVGGRYAGSGNASVALRAAPVASGPATLGGIAVQYSDALDPAVMVTATDADTSASSLTAAATGLPPGLELTRPSNSQASWSVTGAATGAPGDYPVTVTVSDGARTDEAAFTITVTREDATASYSGDTQAYAGFAAHLAATVAPAADGTPGNTDTATVTFREGATTLCANVPVSGGTAGCDAVFALGAHTISLTVGGRYTGTGTGAIDAITPVAPVASDDATVGRAAAQYSDPLARTVTVSATDGDTPAASLTASASGLPHGLSLSRTAPSEAAWTVSGTVDDALGDYPVSVTVSDGNLSDRTSFTVAVVAEDADVTAVGGDATSVTATVRDRSDGAPGDLAHARLSYRDGDATLCSDLVVAASCAVRLATGTHAISALVGGRYTGSGGADVSVAAATLKPDLGLVRKRLRVSRTGRVALKLRCTPSTLVNVPARCAGSVVLKARGRTVGKRAFDIGSASGGTVRVKLTKRGLRTRRVRLTMTVRNPGKAPSTASKSFALRRIR